MQLVNWTGAVFMGWWKQKPNWSRQKRRWGERWSRRRVWDSKCGPSSPQTSVERGAENEVGACEGRGEERDFSLPQHIFMSLIIWFSSGEKLCQEREGTIPQVMPLRREEGSNPVCRWHCWLESGRVSRCDRDIPYTSRSIGTLGRRGLGSLGSQGFVFQ